MKTSAPPGLFCLLNNLSELRILTPFYLVKNDYQWVNCIFLKTITLSPLPVKPRLRSTAAQTPTYAPQSHGARRQGGVPPTRAVRKRSALLSLSPDALERRSPLAWLAARPDTLSRHEICQNFDNILLVGVQRALQNFGGQRALQNVSEFGKRVFQ